jgi:hypothetical protein
LVDEIDREPGDARCDCSVVDLPTFRRAGSGAGSAASDSFPHHCAQALADRLEIAYEEFPGAHNGFITHPRAFAAKLADVLAATTG